MFIFEKDGVSHRVSSGEDILKATGVFRARPIIMTDESGQVVGLGNSVQSLNQSVPLVKALREGKLMLKSAAGSHKAAQQTKPQAALQASLSGFSRLQAELNAMRRAN